jgi:NAD(P)-dependent dehydrogenase (short-subunit alcohol dehydrogenase family)
MGFSNADISDQTGRTIVVTGANSGIGKEAARTLAARGARVVLAVRNTGKGEEAAAGMAQSAEVQELDLADLASVRRFAEGWSDPIDILINNAGVMATPLIRTADGFELQFGTNHLGHFALTNLLLPHVTGRVVTLSSAAHRTGKLDFDDLNWERKTYRRWPAYGQSKLANLLFSSELQRRLSAAGSPVLATAAHPGYAATGLQSHSDHAIMNLALGITTHLVAQNAADGSLPTLYAAVADVPPDAYAGPGSLMESRGAPKLVGRSRAARDLQQATRLWTASEELTGVGFPL